MASRWAASGDGDLRLFDVSTEQVIAYARLWLSTMALLAIYFDPTQPARYAGTTYYLLVLYVVFAVLAVAVAAIGTTGKAWPLGTHLFDIAAAATLMHLTEGPTSPFFVYFTFTILSATLRWDWRGAVATAGLQFALLWFLVAVDPEAQMAAADEVNRVIMRGTYLLVLGLMLGFVGAYRARNQDRFAQLAAWPALENAAAEEPSLKNVLGHAAGVTAAQKIIVAFEQADEPYFNLCAWEDGDYRHDRELTAETAPGAVAEELAGAPFMTEGGAAPKVVTARGVLRLRQPAFSAELEARHDMRRVVAAPFAQGPFSGHVFAVHCRRLTDAQLPLMEIVAYRVGIELEHHHLRQQSAAAALAHQRIRMAGQMHDGILQSLTAATLHLKAIGRKTEDKLTRQLAVVGEIIAGEQGRVRHLVDSMRPPAERHKTFRLASDGERLLKEIGRRWHCETPLSVTPSHAQVPLELGEHLYLIFAETIANAVRHGKARRVFIDISCDGAWLDLRMDDDGKGFYGLWGEYDLASLAAQGIGPKSLCERVRSLGGELRLISGAGGAGIHTRLPL